jgi:hypothetical protein
MSEKGIRTIVVPKGRLCREPVLVMVVRKSREHLTG